MWSQVGLRKHHYEQSWWRWWNPSWAISNPERWCCESAAHNMPANLENSAVAMDRKRSVFIPIPKKGNAKECSNYHTNALISAAAKWLQLCLTLCDPETAAHQAPPSLEFSRQEHWSGLPFPSPMHESEKWKWSHSVMSNSSQPHGLQPTRVLHPWDFPGKNTGVGCHCLLWHSSHTLVN